MEACNQSRVHIETLIVSIQDAEVISSRLEAAVRSGYSPSKTICQ